MEKKTRSQKRAEVGQRNAEATPTSDRVEGTEPSEVSADLEKRARAAISVGLTRLVRHTIEVRIQGDSLITNAWGHDARNEYLRSQQMTKAEKKAAKDKRPPKNPHADYMDARYLRNNKDYFPANGIKQAIVEAALELGIPKKATQRHVRILGDLVEIEGCKPVMREDTVKIGPFNNRQPDLRYRPHYVNWHCDLQIQYTADLFTPEQIISLVDRAGNIGIGEWRADKNGDHGRFEVVAIPGPAKHKKTGDAA